MSVTKITGTVKGVLGYVILNYAERHSHVVITNARAASILTCDKIASQNSRRITRPYGKKMSWLQDQQQLVLSEVRSLKEPIDSRRLKLT